MTTSDGVEDESVHDDHSDGDGRGHDDSEDEARMTTRDGAEDEGDA